MCKAAETHHRIAAVLAIGVLVVSSACADRVPLEAPVLSGQRLNVTQRPLTIRREEQAFDDLARRHPGFGGYYRSPKGELVMVSTLPSEKAALQSEGAAIGIHMSSAFRDSPIMNVRVVDGKYTFWQLAQIRDFLADQALGRIRGLHALDLDERANRVQIDVTPESQAAVTLEVNRLLRDAALDSLALVVVPSERARATSYAPWYAPHAPIGSDLTAYSDELVGGLVWNASPRSVMCSVGAVVDRSGTRGFVSASHCTGSMFSVDGAAAYQPSIQQGRQIASESVDPNGQTCYYTGPDHTWGWFACRWSDAAFFSTNGAISMSKGLIARPWYGTATWGDSGTRTIDSAKPFFIITSTAGSLGGTGFYMHKVGWRTGWTTGYLTNTCKDVVLPDQGIGEHVLKCQYISTNYNNEGDSGGSVFLLDPITGEASLAGTVVGTFNSNSMILSPWWRIVDELGGSIDATRGYSLSTPSVSGSVSLYGNPITSWSDIPGATRYVVFREWFRVSTGEGGSDEFEQASGVPDTDFQVTSYTGSSVPGPHTPGYVAYPVVAYSSADLSLASSVKYFQLAP